MKFCMNCGSRLNEGDSICPECGADIAGAAARMNKVMEKASTEKTEQKTAQMPGFLGMGMNLSGRYFSYSTHGMMFNSGYDLQITENEGKLTAVYRQASIAPENAKSFEVDEAFFEKIVSLIDQFNGDSWNGFNGRAQGVFDGESFSFSFNDGKGRRINAGGYMMWPEGLGAAIRLIKGMFDEIYDSLFPNLFKIFDKYIKVEVVEKEFGNVYKNRMSSGDLLSAVPLVYGDPGCYNWGENPMPIGVPAYGIFSGYEGKDKSCPGLRAMVVLVDKEAEEGSPIQYTNLKIRYYGMENDQKIRLIEQFKIAKEAVIGNHGEYAIYHFGDPDRTTIGIYVAHRWDSGDTACRIYYDVYRLEKDEVKYLGGVNASIPRETGKVSEEDMNAFCAKAEEGGLSYQSIQWRNEWAKSSFLSCPSVTPIFGFRWFSFKEGKMKDDPDGELKGTPIEGWEVRVFRR